MQTNRLLTMQDAYYEDQMGIVIDSMLLQVHMLGEGAIGQAAFTMKHLWIFSEAYYGEKNSLGLSQDMFQTIAVISVGPGGVVQFGSTQKILETMEFVNQTKRFLQEMKNDYTLTSSENAPSSSNNKSYGLDGLFSSSVYSAYTCFPDITYVNGARHQDLIGTVCSSTHQRMNFEAVDHPSDFSKSTPVEKFNNALTATMSNDPFSQAMELISASSNSVQSSITNAFKSDGKEKSSNIFSVEYDLLDSFGADFGCGEDDWEDFIMPEVNGDHLDLGMGTSESISDKHVGSSCGARKGLFSKFGIEELLDCVSGTSDNVERSSFEDQLSSMSKQRRTESSLQASEQRLFKNQTSSLQPVYNMGMTNNDGAKKEFITKSKKKATKEKVKRGNLPTPPHRLKTYGSLLELRVLINNGEKMTIDCLLGQAIKSLLFLQSLIKHAHILKKADEPRGNGLIKNDKFSSNSGGFTWACETGDQTIVCPLIVEDLSAPGRQMFIEMLYDEKGCFLEIVDIIQGIGFTILKGMMEVRVNQIWARVIVETQGNRHTTRHETFSALIQLLQLTPPIGANASDQLGNDIDGGSI
ncbi:hypothetical protein LguiB_028993 [Lonicera macranthoides]